MKLKVCIILFIFINFQTAFSQEGSLEKKRIVKVLSFNILHGATTKGDFNLDAIAKVIIDANPDFVALQEVDYKTNRAHIMI